MSLNCNQIATNVVQLHYEVKYRDDSDLGSGLLQLRWCCNSPIALQFSHGVMFTLSIHRLSFTNCNYSCQHFQCCNQHIVVAIVVICRLTFPSLLLPVSILLMECSVCNSNATIYTLQPTRYTWKFTRFNHTKLWIKRALPCVFPTPPPQHCTLR